MDIKKHTTHKFACIMAVAMLLSIVPIPTASAAETGINLLRPFDTCANYSATGPGNTDTLFQALFPNRFAVIAGGALNGRAGPNNEPVWLVLHNNTSEPVTLGFEVSSGFFCEGATQDAVVGHANKTGKYVGYLDLPTSDTAAPTQAPAQAASSDQAPAQSQFVVVNKVMLNRDLSQCRWGAETQKGETKAIGFLVLPGEIGLAFGWAIDGMEGRVRRTFSEGNNVVAITDGFVVVCSTIMAFQPEVFEGYKLLEATSFGWDGQHLFGQATEVQGGFLQQAMGDWAMAAVLWKNAHNQQWLDSQKPATAPTPAAPAPAATATAPSGKPVRFADPGPLTFSKGEAVFGAFIRVDGANNPVGMCYYSSAPNSGSVSGGVIGRMPFQQEINEQKLVPCG